MEIEKIELQRLYTQLDAYIQDPTYIKESTLENILRGYSF